MGTDITFEIAKNIPTRFKDIAIAKCKNFVLAEWKRITDMPDKVYSLRLNDGYRVLAYPKYSFAGVYNHNEYMRKINYFKKKR